MPRVEEDRDRLQREAIALVARINEATERLAAITGKQGEELQRILNKPLDERDLDRIALKQKIPLRNLYQQIREIAANIEAMKSQLNAKNREIDALNEQLIEANESLIETTAKLAFVNELNAQAEQKLKSFAEKSAAEKKSAEDTAKKINRLRERLRIAKLDAINNAHEIISLTRELNASEHSRKHAFVMRANRVYLRNMQKPDVYGEQIELQAIANLLKKNIEVWRKNGVYNVMLIRSEPFNGDTSTTPMRIFKNNIPGNTLFSYQPIAKEFDANVHDDVILSQIPEDSNSLFSACVRALQITNGDLNVLPADNKYLSIAAYSLRLETCGYLSKHNESISKLFSTIVDNIYTPISFENETQLAASSAATKRVYNIIRNELPSSYKKRQFIDNICKLIGQHYPEVSDEHVKESSDARSISSYSSLEDEDDYAIFGSSKFDINLAQHEIEVKKFFMGKVGTSENGTLDNDDLRVAKRYVNYLEREATNIGGPIEIQAIAEKYNWQVNLKAFVGQDRSTNPQYSNIFYPSSPKDGVKSIYLIMLNAGTSRARYILLDKDVEKGSGSLYRVCQDIAGKSDTLIRTDVIEHLKEKIKSIYNPDKKKKPNDGISNYFYDYIYKGHKGAGNGIKEFDLIPKAECIEDAHKLRATRKIIFKTANTFLNTIEEEIASEMSGWTIHLSSLAKQDDLRLTFADKVKLSMTSLALLELLALTTSIAIAVIGEKDSSTGPVPYNALQGLAITGNVLSSLLYCINHLAQEIRRSKVVRSSQENFILHLPFDKISTILLHYKTSEMPYILENPFNHEYIKNEWSTAECSGLSFRINDDVKEYFITKEEHVSRNHIYSRDSLKDSFKKRTTLLAQDAHRSMYKSTPGILALLTVINLGLTIGTFVDVSQQIIVTANTTSGRTHGPTQSPTSLSVISPATAYGSIGVTAVAAVLTLIHASDSPIRVCEKELSIALKAIKDTYVDNQGNLPTELAALLQNFGVDAVFANALSTTPQMVNVQRGLFKAKQELKEHIEELRSTQQADLLSKLEDIERGIDVSKIEEIQSNNDALLVVTEDLRRASESISTSQPAASTQMASSVQGSTLIGTLNRLSGLLRFGSSSTKAKQPAIKKSAKQPKSTP